MKTIAALFDQDGTLTDSGPGIYYCFKKAMAEMDYPIPEDSKLRIIVGPPLRDSFICFGVPEEKVEEAITRYRKWYFTEGLLMNTPYPGIAELLKKLFLEKEELYVATSKPTPLATSILQNNHVYSYFNRIYGASFDKSHDKKELIVKDCLDSLAPSVLPVMIGDTSFDVQGARKNNILSIAVTWGYGSKESLVEAKPDYLVSTVKELDETLEKLRRSES